jgi:hypothetical protein
MQQLTCSLVPHQRATFHTADSGIPKSTGVSASRRLPMKRVRLTVYISWRMMFDEKYVHDTFPMRGKVGTF